MKVSVDCPCADKLFELTPLQMQVIANDIQSEILDADLKRRLEYILMHKYQRCMDRLEKEWVPKLIAGGATSIPTAKDALAELIFAHPDYKNRSVREAEAEAALNAK